MCCAPCGLLLSVRSSFLGERCILRFCFVGGHVVGQSTSAFGSCAADNALCLHRIRLVYESRRRLTGVQLILIELIVLHGGTVVQNDQLLPRNERSVAVAYDGWAKP